MWFYAASAVTPNGGLSFIKLGQGGQKSSTAVASMSYGLAHTCNAPL